jgi:hypothetical protein
MKNKWAIFLFLAFFVLVNGFGQQNSGDINSELLKEIHQAVVSPLPDGDLVPLTMSIVNLIINKNIEIFEELDFYLSSDLVITTFPEKDPTAARGGLVIETGNIIQTTKILRKSEGKYIEYNPKENEESFSIRFQGYDDHVLQFRRNPRTNRFDFYAMDKSCKFENPRPFLCIFVDKIGKDFPQVDTTSRYGSHSRGSDSGSSSDHLPVSIMGNGRLNKNAVVSYIVNKGSAMSRQQIDTLVSHYIREAQTERIDHDIAIAQMCYATNFLNNRQLLDTYNYAGLNTDMGISVRGGNRHIDMGEGVRAHIQHLKGYASRDPLNSVLVDRRYNLIKTSSVFGTVNTLDRLFAVWSPHNTRDYGDGIKRILRELYQFPGRI